MLTRFSISLSAAALFASASMGVTAARAGDDNAAGPAAHDYNTENGVHAVPSGHVGVQRLADVAGARSVRVPIKPAPTKAIRVAPATARTIRVVAPRTKSNSLQWLSLQLADAPKGPVVALPDPAVQPPPPAAAPAPAVAAPVAVAATAASPPAPGPAAVQAAAALEVRPAAAPAAAAVSVPASAPAPAPPPAALVAAAATEPSPPAAVAPDGPPPGASEEDAVYRRVAPGPAADKDAPAGAALQPIRDEAPADQTSVQGQAPAPDRGPSQHVAFPRRSAEAAGVFDGYMRAVAAIDAGFRSGEGVAGALETASAYDPRQLEEGMIAYGAMAALQSPRFVYGVMDIAADGRDREAMVAELLADPGAAARLPGAHEAASLASGAILGEAKPVVSAGRAIKQASYDVQHQSWSIAPATNQSGRLARAKALSATTVPAREGDIARILGQITALERASADDAEAISPVAARSLALAALSILSETSPDPDRLASMTTEEVSAECLKMAKLNLFQCLSVAGPEYEDVYCLGQHAVLDTGSCVAEGASPLGASLALETPPVRLPRTPD